MKRILILLTLLLGMGMGVEAQRIDVKLSDKAFASLLTCGAGNDFYTTFGHTALRICDSSIMRVYPTRHRGVEGTDTLFGLDIVYNYGTFDFDTPHFYLKFARGKLNYCLSRSTFSNFLLEYTFEGRYVTEQRLNLTNEELNRLFDAMEENYMPENRYYQYDFFKDNCATRIRDQINDCITLREGVEPPFVESVADTNRTFRQILDPCMDLKLEWWKFGLDMLLGSICDKPASNLDYDFAPEELSRQLDTLVYEQVLMSDSAITYAMVPLALPKHYILEETRPQLRNSLYPTLVFWCLFLVVTALTVISWVKQSRGSRRWKLRGLDALLFLLTGIVSLVVMFMWFLSDYYCTKGNLNILWASPLFLYLGIFTARSNRWVVMVQMAMLMVLLTGFWWLPQKFNDAVIPVALTLMVRLIAILKEKGIRPQTDETNN